MNSLSKSLEDIGKIEEIETRGQKIKEQHFSKVPYTGAVLIFKLFTVSLKVE